MRNESKCCKSSVKQCRCCAGVGAEYICNAVDIYSFYKLELVNYYAGAKQV